MLHTSGVVPLIQLSLRRCCIGFFVSSIFLFFLTLSNPFLPVELLALCKRVVHPCKEYASHIWGGSTHTALLKKVLYRVFRLINFLVLSNSLQSLSASRIAASLSLNTIAITTGT